MKALSKEQLCTWSKEDGIDHDEDSYLELDKCVDSEKDICFEFGKCIWRKHRSVFQDHLKYIHNDIVNPFCVEFFLYSELN